MPLPYITRVILSPPVRDLIAENFDRGHVHVLASQPRGLGEHPRKAAGVLWHLDARRSLLSVQSSQVPVRPELLGAVVDIAPIAVPPEGDIIDVRISLSCVKTPPSNIPPELRAALKETPKASGQGRCYRSKQVVVPEEERLSWAVRRLARIGLTSDEADVHLQPLRYAPLGKRGRGIPYVEVQARSTVTDVHKLSDAIASGLGKGKNFGLGMLRIQHTASVPAPT